MIVDEFRLDGLDLRILDVLHKLTHHVAIGGDGRDGRLVNLLLQGVSALFLEDSGIAVGEETVGKGHNLCLGHLRNTVHAMCLLLPCGTIDERTHHLTYAPHIVVEGTLTLEFHVIHDARQEVVREFTLLQVLHLAQHQGTNFFQRLLGFRHADE